LPGNIHLGLKLRAVTNALAYYEPEINTTIQKVYTTYPWKQLQLYHFAKKEKNSELFDMFDFQIDTRGRIHTTLCKLRMG
jgi:hypothetical protein